MAKKKKAGKYSNLRRKSRNLEDKNLTRRELNVVISLKDLDKNQGQTLEEWKELGLNTPLLEKLVAACSMTINEATTKQVIKQYTKVEFPPSKKFSHPKHVKSGVTWAVMHLQGKECIAGYLIENVFYIVFLDKDHEFWPSKKR